MNFTIAVAPPFVHPMTLLSATPTHSVQKYGLHTPLAFSVHYIINSLHTPGNVNRLTQSLMCLSMGSLAWGLCIMPIYSQVSLEGHIWVSYQKGVFYGIEVVHFPCTNFWNLMSDWEGHQVAVNFTCIYCKCRYASDSILALTCLIDRFHGIFYYGNWRALHHHTACWLVNIHIAWPFAFQLQLVAIVKR